MDPRTKYPLIKIGFFICLALIAGAEFFKDRPAHANSGPQQLCTYGDDD
jgi:hypothetical protein